MKKQRKEIHLEEKTVKALTKLAKADNRKLKPYMEKILSDHAEQSNAPAQ